MKQVFGGENPLCQLNIGAKKGVNPQLRVSKMHTNPRAFTPFSAVFVCFLLDLLHTQAILRFCY